MEVDWALRELRSDLGTEIHVMETRGRRGTRQSRRTQEAWGLTCVSSSVRPASAAMRHSVVGSGYLLTFLKLYSRISNWSSVGPLAVCADMVRARLQGKQMHRVSEARLLPPTEAPRAAGVWGPPSPGRSPTWLRMERRKKTPPACYSEGTVEEAPQELPPEIRSCPRD